MEAKDVFANEKTAMAYENWAAWVRKVDAAQARLEVAYRTHSATKDHSMYLVNEERILELSAERAEATIQLDLAKHALSYALRDEPAYGDELKEHIAKVMASLEGARILAGRVV